MKKILALLSCGIFTMLNVSAQSNDTGSLQAWDIMNKRSDHLAKEAIGTEYAFDGFRTLKLFTFGGISTDINDANINLLSSSVDIMVDKSLNEISSSKFSKIEIYILDELVSTFYPLREFDVIGEKKGMYEHINAGEYDLVVNHSIASIKPDPNAKITGGETRVKLVKKSKTFMKNGSSYVEIGKPKDISKVIGAAKFKTLSKIAAEQNLDLKNHKSLARALRMLQVGT